VANKCPLILDVEVQINFLNLKNSYVVWHATLWRIYTPRNSVWPVSLSPRMPARRIFRAVGLRHGCAQLRQSLRRSNCEPTMFRRLASQSSEWPFTGNFGDHSLWALSRSNGDFPC
jgi:hypothetical protein